MKHRPFLLLSLFAITWSIDNIKASAEPSGSSLAPYWSASLQAETDNNYGEAITRVAAYQQRGGDKYLAILRTGWLNYLNQNYTKAAASYSGASQLQPIAITPLLGLLSVAQAQNDAFKIQGAADAVLKVEPSNYKAQMALAGMYYTKKDYRKALSSYRRILTFYPEDIDATSGEAWCSFYLDNPQQALRGFEKILSVNPSYPYAQDGLDLLAGKPPKNTPQNGGDQKPGDPASANSP